MKLLVLIVAVLAADLVNGKRCDENDYPSELTSFLFYECIFGIPFLSTCPEKFFYNPTSKTCDSQNDKTDDVSIVKPPISGFANVSCDGVDNFDFVPSPITCTEYFQCIDDVAYLISCPRGLYFSPSSRRCTYPDEANCVITPPTSTIPPTTPPTGPNVSCDGVPNFRFVPSPVSCSNYYQCLDGNAFLLSCPRGLYFAENIQTCTYPDQANCVVTPPTTTEPPTSPPPTTTPGPGVSCDGVDNFDFIPSPITCSEYFQCIDDVAYLLSCPRGLYFSPSMRRCTYPDEANCVITPPTLPPPTTTPGPGDSCDGVDNFDFIPSPITCSEYFQCIDDVAFLLSCPRGLYFSPSLRRCTYPDQANCVILPPTSTVPPTTPPTGPNVSCDGVPNFRFVSSPVSCSNYYQCLDGNAFLLSCPRGLYFAENIGTCTYPSNVDCVTTNRPSNIPIQQPFDAICEGVENFRLIEHPSSCAFYFQCIGGTSFIASCPAGRYFEERIQGCVESNEAECGDRARRSSTTTLAPIIDPQCEGVAEGRFVANQNSCYSFFQCLDGRAVPRFCDDGLWFDEQLQRCDIPGNVNCPAVSTTITSTTVSTTFVIPTVPNISPCDGQPDETWVGSAVYCEKFFFCMNGIAYPNTCQDGYWFDRTLLECHPMDEVDCSLQTMPTTTQIITTTDNSPAGLCREARNATYVRNSMACGEFYTCIDGEPFRRVCREGLWFNTIQQRCTETYEAWCELDERICDGIEGRFRAPNSCADFITCDLGFPRPGRCWGDLFFNEDSGECEPREEVDCDLNISTEEPTGPCDGIPDFSLAGSSESCNEYFVCYADEIIQTVQCPGSQVFDFETQVCGNFECSFQHN